MEILTAKEVAAMLKISNRQVYELANPRNRAGDRREHPLPAFRINSTVRFRRQDVEEWVEKLAKAG
jgi:predicted DNA-binding transcriptional regulator AlpA